jgi:hypothetical protein
MEWMRELGEIEGKLKCEKCGDVIGMYNWIERQQIGREPPVPVFKIEKEHVKKCDVIVEV